MGGALQMPVSPCCACVEHQQTGPRVRGAVVAKFTHAWAGADGGNASCTGICDAPEVSAVDRKKPIIACRLRYTSEETLRYFRRTPEASLLEVER